MLIRSIFAATCILGIAPLLLAQDEVPIKALGGKAAEQLFEDLKADIRVNMLPAVDLRVAEIGLAGGVRNLLTPFSLRSLTKAKFVANADQPKVIFMIEGYRTEERRRTVTVMRMEAEEQIEQFVDEDGKTQERTRVVRVPKPQEIEQTYSMQVSAGTKPKVVKLDQVKFYRMDGSQVEESELKKELAKLTTVFLWRADPNRAEVPAASPLIRDAVRPGMLVAVTRALDPKP